MTWDYLISWALHPNSNSSRKRVVVQPLGAMERPGMGSSRRPGQVGEGQWGDLALRSRGQTTTRCLAKRCVYVCVRVCTCVLTEMTCNFVLKFENRCVFRVR